MKSFSLKLEESDDNGFYVKAYHGKNEIGIIVIVENCIEGEGKENHPFGPYYKESFFEEITFWSCVMNIEHIEVKKEYRGLGVATKLMKKAMTHFNKYFGIPIYVNASPMDQSVDLDSLISFYEKFGFKLLVKYPKHRNALLWKEFEY